MIEAGSINTASAAFFAGLISSLHCVAMCGPIACSVCAGCGETSRATTGSLYHLGRIFSYAVVGGIMGGTGGLLFGWMTEQTSWIVMICLILLFVMIAFQGTESAQESFAKNKWLLRFKLKMMSMSRWQSSLLAGLVTPLIPCGALYLLWLGCMLTNSAVRGTELGMAFAAGTVPLLLLSQFGYHFLAKRFTRAQLVFAQRGFAVIAIALILWRMRAVFGIEAGEAWLCH